MEIKKCSKCLNLLNISLFYQDKNKKNSLSSQCKECKNKTTKERRLKIKNSNIKIPEEKLCFCCKEKKLSNCFYKTKTNNDGLSIYCKICKLNKEKERNSKIQNIIIDENIIKKCYICKLEKSLKFFKINKKSNDNFSYICIECSPKNNWTIEKQRAYDKKYRCNNPEKLAEKYKKQSKNINRRVRDSLNHRISDALKVNKNNKINKTVIYIGCKIYFLKLWIENLFQKDMSWENYGKWQFDHVLPCSSFDLSNDEQIKECFNWKNLQPLWKEDNLKKSDKIDKKLIIEHENKIKKFIITLNSAQLKDGELLE